jgi:hypothetical protein
VEKIEDLNGGTVNVRSRKSTALRIRLHTRSLNCAMDGEAPFVENTIVVYEYFVTI